MPEREYANMVNKYDFGVNNKKKGFINFFVWGKRGLLKWGRENSSRYTILKNRLSNHFFKLSYVTESANWVIKWDGKYITENLSKLNLIKARTTTKYLGIKNQIIHFGSVHTFSTSPHESNKVVVTWFHVVPDDPKIKFVKEVQKKYVDHFSKKVIKKKVKKKNFRKLIGFRSCLLCPLSSNLHKYNYNYYCAKITDDNRNCKNNFES